MCCCIPNRSAERRRSSIVVSLPGLEVFPGDLLVSDSAVDYLHHSALLPNAGQAQDGICLHHILKDHAYKVKWPYITAIN